MKNKRKIHLIITTANISEDICKRTYGSGYSYEKRIDDYNKSFELALKFKENFNSITLLETVSKEILEYLHNYDFNVSYSNLDNFFINKGLNEINHINNYLKNNTLIDDNDLIIKLSGRYFLTNMNILNFIDNYDIITKDDKDIYWSGLGVHSFYFGITKKLFFDFYNFVDLKFDNKEYKKDVAIEWDLKKFVQQNNKSYIIPPQEKIGIITNTYYRDINCCKIEYV